jgi:hypothetical protein
MATTVEHPTDRRAAGRGQTAAGGAPADRRPRPPVRVAESVLGSCAFVLVGLVLPVAGIPAGLLVVLRRRAERGPTPSGVG